MARPRKYPDELIERGIRLAMRAAADRAHRRRSRDPPGDVAQAGAPGRGRQRQAAGAAGQRGARGDPAAAQGELRAAPGERDPQVGVGVFREGARPGPTEVSRYIDEHRGRFGVEPICRTLGVSASAYYQRDTGRRSRGRSRTSGCSADPRAARRELLRLRLAPDVEGAAARGRAGRRAARSSG